MSAAPVSSNQGERAAWPILDWAALDADVAVLGVPNDMGTQWRSGARFGPRGIREASTLFSFGHAGAYDHEDDVMYLTASDVRMVDVGDADIVHTDMVTSNKNTEYAVRKILDAGVMPVVLGGDHSVHAPVIKAFEGRGPIHIIPCGRALSLSNTSRFSAASASPEALRTTSMSTQRRSSLGRVCS